MVLNPLSASSVQYTSSVMNTLTCVAMLVSSCGCAIQISCGLTRSLNLSTTFSSLLPLAVHYSLMFSLTANLHPAPSCSVDSAQFFRSPFFSLLISILSPPHVSSGGFKPGDTATKYLTGFALLSVMATSPPSGKSC